MGNHHGASETRTLLQVTIEDAAAAELAVSSPWAIRLSRVRNSSRSTRSTFASWMSLQAGLTAGANARRCAATGRRISGLSLWLACRSLGERHSGERRHRRRCAGFYSTFAINRSSRTEVRFASLSGQSAHLKPIAGICFEASGEYSVSGYSPNLRLSRSYERTKVADQDIIASSDRGFGHQIGRTWPRDALCRSSNTR